MTSEDKLFQTFVRWMFGTLIAVFLSMGVTDILIASKRQVSRLGGEGVPKLSACGTTPSINGTDGAGVITLGSGTVTTCTLTFTRAYGVSPICTVTGSSGTINIGITSITTTTLVLGTSASLPSGKIYYLCSAM